MGDPPCPYVSRGGLKLGAALDAFDVDPAGLVCADLGCNVGGFTDCLLRRGAARVYSVDTGYGALAWKLRQDARIVVLERTNALHFDPATIANFTGCALVTIDLAWTRQRHAIPAALRWLRADKPASGTGDAGPTSATGRSGGGAMPLIITLIKPHYEADRELLPRQKRGVLDDEKAQQVTESVLAAMPELGVRVIGHIRSPIRGGAGKGRQGNIEHLALLARS